MNKRDYELIDMLIRVFDDFLREESFLIEKDLAERCMVHKFAQLFEHEVKKHVYLNKFITNRMHVDCEYNRDIANNHNTSVGVTCNRSSMIPDLIIHERGKINNSLVIEFKKSKNEGSLKRYNKADRIKINRYVKQKNLLYDYGLIVNFPHDLKFGFRCLVIKKTNNKSLKNKKYQTLPRGGHIFDYELV